MVSEESILVTLLRLVERLPMPPPAAGGRGCPRVYSDRLVLRALVVMIIKGLPTAHLLVSVVNQPTAEMRQVRALLMEQGRFPSRRTWERRLAVIPDRLPEQIAWLGRHLVDRIQPWQQEGRAAAIDSTVVRAHGGYGTRNTERRTSYRIPRLIPKPTGRNRAGMAGSMVGSCV